MEEEMISMDELRAEVIAKAVERYKNGSEKDLKAISMLMQAEVEANKRLLEEQMDAAHNAIERKRIQTEYDVEMAKMKAAYKSSIGETVARLGGTALTAGVGLWLAMNIIELEKTGCITSKAFNWIAMKMIRF